MSCVKRDTDRDCLKRSKNAGDKIPFGSFRCASCRCRDHRRSLWFPSVRLFPKLSRLWAETRITRQSLPGCQPLARLAPHTTDIVMEPEIDCEKAVSDLFHQLHRNQGCGQLPSRSDMPISFSRRSLLPQSGLYCTGISEQSIIGWITSP